MAVDAQTFLVSKGTPRSFNKKDHSWSPTRHLFEICGVHLTARSERAPERCAHQSWHARRAQCVRGSSSVTWTSNAEVSSATDASYLEIPQR